MPNNSPARVRDSADVDPRIARTTHALGRALIELIQERDFSDVTVQHILDRAGVGRTTFYAHYRNKDDVLHSSYDRVFAAFDTMLERPSSIGTRLFPVAEFLTHVGEMHGLVEALRKAGRIDDAWDLCTGYAARTIERRIGRSVGTASEIRRPLLARMLAGALMEAIGWWQDHPSAATPAEMDAAFHELARGVLRVAPH
jgi:AcrR family transcriptional regulator